MRTVQWRCRQASGALTSSPTTEIRVGEPRCVTRRLAKQSGDRSREPLPRVPVPPRDSRIILSERSVLAGRPPAAYRTEGPPHGKPRGAARARRAGGDPATRQCARVCELPDPELTPRGSAVWAHQEIISCGSNALRAKLGGGGEPSGSPIAASSLLVVCTAPLSCGVPLSRRRHELRDQHGRGRHPGRGGLPDAAPPTNRRPSPPAPAVGAPQSGRAQR